MAYAVPEEDAEEATRMLKAEIAWLGGRVTALKAVCAPTTRDGAFFERMDMQLNVFRRMVPEVEVQLIKTLSWKYRREMPAHTRPKLPPNDPVVREMEANGG